MKFNLDQLVVRVLFVRILFACIDRTHLQRKKRNLWFALSRTFKALSHSRQLACRAVFFSAFSYIQLVICYDIFLPGSFNLCAIGLFFCFPFWIRRRKKNGCEINRFVIWSSISLARQWQQWPLAKCTRIESRMTQSKLYNWINSFLVLFVSLLCETPFRTSNSNCQKHTTGHFQYEILVNEFFCCANISV